ncbi:MAG: universal stress protein [Bacteroidales bacterium]|nr:universal stress protein [Bacteroidales bacterium]
MGSKYDTPHDQFVIAYLPHPDKTEAVVSHALPLAQMLHKGLILLYINDPRYGGPTKEEAQHLLADEVERIRPQHPDTNYIALAGNSREVISALPTLLYGVVVVAESNNESPRRSPTHPKEVLRLFAESKIAYLVVQQRYEKKDFMSDVTLTIDYRRESKEKLIWASYMARFNHSHLHILSQQYKDEGLHKAWHDNIRFMEKMFASLGISDYTIENYAGRGPFAETGAIEDACRKKYDMHICTTTDMHDRDTLELLIGTAEQRVIRNPWKYPILFLNPRDDLYVLCD